MFRRLLALAVILPIAACTASNLSSLQSSFRDVQETRIECREATASEEEMLLCTGSQGPVLLDIARQSVSAVEGAGDARTRIGLYRLAATAGWQSRLPDGLSLAADAGAVGTQLCAGLPQGSFGAPRDCALLATTDIFVAHQRAVSALEGLEGAEGPEARRALDDLRGSYVPNTLRALEAKRQALDARALDPAFFTYLDRQRPVFVCTVLKMATLYYRLGENDIARELEADARALRQEFGITGSC